MKHKATYILSLLTTMVWLYQFFRYGLAATNAINLLILEHSFLQLFLMTLLRYGVSLHQFCPYWLDALFDEYFDSLFIGRQVEAVLVALTLA